MTVVIGPVLLLVASTLLSAVLLLAALGLVLWISRLRRRPPGGLGSLIWTPAPKDMAGRDGASIAAPGE